MRSSPADGRPTILVIGDVMTDILVRPEGPVAIGADRRATIRVMPGGSGANQAAWLASFGIRTVFAGRVGSFDQLEQEKLLAGCGVVPALGRDQALPTGTIVTLLSGDGERSFLTDRGANDNLCGADLPDRLLDGVSLVHVSGYSLFGAGPRAAVLELLAKAGRRKVPFTLDAGSYSFLQEAGPENFLAWTRSAEICFANAREAEVLAGTPDREGQLQSLTRLYPLVVIKAGADGAIAGSSRGERWTCDAPPAKVVDSSGAGDAFLAAFLSRYLGGEPIESCMRAGVQAGSRASTILGGRPPVFAGT